MIIAAGMRNNKAEEKEVFRIHIINMIKSQHKLMP